jgi:uncharacterized membrane protein YuzA (DUF378 family)
MKGAAVNCSKSNFLDKLALILAIVGALNWGILVVFNRELIMGFLKLGPDIANILYVAFAVSGLWCLFSILPKVCKK